MSIFRTKAISQSLEESPLHRCLNSFNLVLLGIGAIIGAGVFVLTGVAAALKAGPAISLSYVLAGTASLFAALCYAELAASVGGCGSAYNYAYASFGELVAWIIGWALILEYAIAVSSVAIGWSGYVNNALESMNIIMPKVLTINPFEGGWVNLPAMLSVLALSFLLAAGVRQSARFNEIVVYIKLATVAMFIIFAVKHVEIKNWQNFFPFGYTGVVQGAAIVFFAYIGFDAVSTAADECINPQRDLPIGIIGSVCVCTIIYVVVAALLTGITSYTNLNVASPVADALLHIGYPVASGLISAGAIAGLTTVMLVMFYGLTRICYAISRDGLLPPFFSSVNERTKTPVAIIFLTGIVMALVAGFVPLGEAAALVNIGTLAAFTIVCGGVVALRWLHPELPRPFKLPFNPAIPLIGAILCVFLMLHLSSTTWKSFAIWLVLGLIIYFSYGYRHSILKKSN